MAKNDDSYKVSEHQLFISPLSLWLKLKRHNKISPRKRWMSFKITVFVIFSAPFRWIQTLLIRNRLKNVDLSKKPPVFVIGHWRSGTTHLHYLLSKDPQFIHLGSFQALLFNVAFVSKRFMKPILNRFMPSTRPQDNVKIDASSPQEEEQPLTNITYMSGLHSFWFPKNRDYFTKYNLFEGIQPKELKRWKKTYLFLLKNIALFNDPQKRLLLKNPHNTGRIKVLLELFPNAKFIYIHRHPMEVFNSMLGLYEKIVKSQFLQDFTDEEIKQRIFFMYEKTLKTYLSQRPSIPADQLYEIAYADLETTPLGELKKIYEKLNLGDFASAEPHFKTYLDSVKNFKKNKPKEIPKEMLERIHRDWSFAFEAWGYSKN